MLPQSRDARPEQVLFLVPKSDYEILDTWFVAGLRASGSKNVVVKEAFVPEHRMVCLLDMLEGTGPGAAGITGPLSGLPFFPALVPTFLASLLGATIGAYKTWCNACRKKLTMVTQEQVATFSHVQIRLAEIEAEIQAAHFFLQHALDMLNSGQPISRERRLRCRRDYAYIARLCVRATEQIFLASGGSANYETNPLQRYCVTSTPWRHTQR